MSSLDTECDVQAAAQHSFRHYGAFDSGSSATKGPARSALASNRIVEDLCYLSFQRHAWHSAQIIIMSSRSEAWQATSVARTNVVRST